MGKRLCLSLLVEMPEDPFDAAGVYVSLKEPWATLLKSLAASGVKHEAKADEMEVRAKVPRKPRKPRNTTNSDAKPLGSGHDVVPQ